MDGDLAGRWCYADTPTGATYTFEISTTAEGTMTISSKSMGGGFEPALLTAAGQSAVASSLEADWVADIGDDGGRIWIQKKAAKGGIVVLTVYYKTEMECAVSETLFAELVGNWRDADADRSYVIQPVMGSLEYREQGYGSGVITLCDPNDDGTPQGGYGYKVNLIANATGGSSTPGGARVMDEVLWLCCGENANSGLPELTTLRQRTSADGAVTATTERARRRLDHASPNPLSLLPLPSPSGYDLVAERVVSRTRDQTRSAALSPISSAQSPQHASFPTSKTHASPAAYLRPKRYRVGDMPAPPPKVQTAKETAEERRERLGISIQGKKQMRKRVLSQIRGDARGGAQNSHPGHEAGNGRLRSPKRGASPHTLRRDVPGGPFLGGYKSPTLSHASPAFSPKDPPCGLALDPDDTPTFHRGEDVEALRGDTWVPAVVKRVKLDGTGYEVLLEGTSVPVVYSTRSRGLRRIEHAPRIGRRAAGEDPLANGGGVRRSSAERSPSPVHDTRMRARSPPLTGRTKSPTPGLERRVNSVTHTRPNHFASATHRTTTPPAAAAAAHKARKGALFSAASRNDGVGAGCMSARREKGDGPPLKPRYGLGVYPVITDATGVKS